ncbi:hypothetical protein SI65_07657 [Aspergillus cristatus]|uniref:Uncharacterized protein n=1 Tax=Aspergillus cristatus TaxID=573508 RepID=A0A1E3B6V6_ASPCR|nr:hypothetical protein SI65_07657 [Aspergillus cristatus]
MDAERLIAMISEVDEPPRLLDPPKDAGLTVNNIKAQRALPILDALANVLVGPVSGETIAVGIQTDEQNVILMLASDNATSNEVGYHDYQADSDEELPVEMASDIYDFEFAVYRFSFPGIQRRLTKVYGAMDSRSHAFGRFIEFPPVDVSTKLMQELKEIYEMVEYIYEAVVPSEQALSANNAQFQDLCITSDTLVDAVEDPFKDTDLSRESQKLDTNYLNFSLIGYLKKIISPPCSVEKLE